MKKLFTTFLFSLVGTMMIQAQPAQDDLGYYLIGTAEDLVEFSAIANAAGGQNSNARLTADIDMTGINFTPIGMHYDEDSPAGIPGDYRGTFDGDGHVIKNLYIERTDKCEAGFIGRTTDATIKNLGIVNATIKQETLFNNGTNIRAGVLAAIILRGTVQNCYTAGNLEIINGTGAKGYLVATFLQNFGGNGNPMVSCFTTADVLTSTESSGTMTNCFAAADIESIGATGEMCYTLNEGQPKIVWYQTLGVDAYPVLDNTHKRVYPIGTLNCDGTPIPGTDITYSNVQSSEIPPHQFDENGICVICGYDSNAFEPAADGWYEITTPAQLRYIATVVNEQNQRVNIRLMNDLDMQNVFGLQPIGYFDDFGKQTPFAGIFDGQGHTISNLTITVPDGQEVGLFGRISGGVVRNLGIINAEMTSSSTIRTGVLGGEIHNGKVQNCFVIGNIVLSNGEGQKGGFAGEAVGTTFTSCFTTYESVAASATLDNTFVGEEVANMAPTGELCYRLNGNSFAQPTWFQTIGEDAYPTLDGSHGMVYEVEEGVYKSALTESDFAEMIEQIITKEKEDLAERPATRTLIDEYLSQLEGLRSSTNRAAFLEAYQGLSGIQQQLAESEAAYASYEAKVAEVKAYLVANPNVSGPDMLVLQDYLEGLIDPGEPFPNGSYEYIMETCALTATELAAENNYVQALLEQAILTGYQPGADISSLLVNPGFTDSTNGWDINQGQVTISNASNSQQGFKKVVVSTNDLDISQTLEGLKDGIYEIEIPGITVQRGIADAQTLGQYNYGGFVYANDKVNYVETKFSDMLEESEVNDKTLVYNASRFTLYYDNEEEPLGYAPNNHVGVAFGRDAGHFRNRILANVTDGRLTVGVRNNKSVTSANNTYLLRAILTYQGEIENSVAMGAMDEILDDMQSKAAHIIEDYVPDIIEISDAPSFYNGLTSELEAAVSAIPSATTGEKKYELIGQFSDIFKRIVSCKQTYERLLNTANDVIDVYGIYGTVEEQTAMMKRVDDIIEIYEEGNKTQDEIEALIDELNEDSFYAKYKTPEMADGYYLISTPWNLVWFSKQVNAGQKGLNARLTTDLDMSVVDNFDPIGLHIDPENGTHTENDFAGTFDGQGHVIRNLTVSTSQGEESGLFGRLQGNVYRLGIENATITSATGVRSGIFAGLILNTTGVINCYTAGELTVNTTHAENAPFANITAFGRDTGIINCYTTGERFGTLSPISGSVVTPNSYCGEDVTTMAPTGELCYKLNGDQSNIVWYQTLGEDSHPVLDSTHLVVLQGDSIYYNEGGDGIETIANTGTKTTSKAIYDLTGRRVASKNAMQNLPKGIYIVNGQKVLVK